MKHNTTPADVKSTLRLTRAPHLEPQPMPALFHRVNVPRPIADIPPAIAAEYVRRRFEFTHNVEPELILAHHSRVVRIDGATLRSPDPTRREPDITDPYTYYVR